MKSGREIVVYSIATPAAQVAVHRSYRSRGLVDLLLTLIVGCMLTAVEQEAATKRRKLDAQSWTDTYQGVVEAVVSIAMVAVLGSLTALF